MDVSSPRLVHYNNKRKVIVTPWACLRWLPIGQVRCYYDYDSTWSITGIYTEYRETLLMHSAMHYV